MKKKLSQKLREYPLEKLNDGYYIKTPGEDTHCGLGACMDIMGFQSWQAEAFGKGGTYDQAQQLLGLSGPEIDKITILYDQLAEDDIENARERVALYLEKLGK